MRRTAKSPTTMTAPIALVALVAAAFMAGGTATAQDGQDRGEYYEEAQDLMNPSGDWEPTPEPRGPALSPLNPNATGNPIAVRVVGDQGDTGTRDGLSLRDGPEQWTADEGRVTAEDLDVELDDRDYEGVPGRTAPTRRAPAAGAFSDLDDEESRDAEWGTWEDYERDAARTDGQGVFSQPEDEFFYGEEDENTAFGGNELTADENTTMGMDRPGEFGADTGDIGRLGEEHEGYGPGLATGQSGGPGARTTGPGNISGGMSGAGSLGSGG